MQIKEWLVGIPLLVFVLWVIFAPVPQARIERACSPITWVGNLTTSTTALAKEEHTATAATWADKLEYSCQYMLWRLFYQKQYNEAIKAGLIKAPEGYQIEVTPAPEEPGLTPNDPVIGSAEDKRSKQ